MAFCQPTFVPNSRPTTSHEPERNAAPTIPSPPQKDVHDSQEWILFPARSTAQTETISTERTPRTAGLSRLSDFGSLAAKSRQDDEIACEATDGSVEDDAELDSLDDGLHAFQGPSMMQRSGYFDQGGSILPRHDGLGTFPASTPPIQEQLWHFERYNPKKRSFGGHQRRRSSVQRKLDAIENNDARVVETERTQRIEKWRMESSLILLDEIEKETKKRRASTTSRGPGKAQSTASQGQVIKDSPEVPTGTQTTKTHQDENNLIESDESFWQRVTRRVIRDFIGIDDSTLSIIFGETIPEERPTTPRSPSGQPTSKSLKLDATVPTTSTTTWETRLLDRMSRELGILVQHLSDHPGAFSTLPNIPAAPDYAGIPITVPTSSKTQPKPPPISQTSAPTASPTSFTFNPTLPAPPSTTDPTADSTHAALWGIEEESPSPSPNSNPQDPSLDYWSQPPDLKTIFRFLHTRFTTQRRPSSSSNPNKPPLNIATTSTPDSLRRAAIIRQYHPLVSSRYPRRQSGGVWRGRSGSSCASSIVGSARWGGGGGVRAGSFGGSGSGRRSRNYWGSTVGSGGVGGGLGAWGEV